MKLPIQRFLVIIFVNSKNDGVPTQSRQVLSKQPRTMHSCKVGGRIVGGDEEDGFQLKMSGKYFRKSVF
jgi:hypothetical protein